MKEVAIDFTALISQLHRPSLGTNLPHVYFPFPMYLEENRNPLFLMGSLHEYYTSSNWNIWLWSILFIQNLSFQTYTWLFKTKFCNKY